MGERFQGFEKRVEVWQSAMYGLFCAGREICEHFNGNVKEIVRHVASASCNVAMASGFSMERMKESCARQRAANVHVR